jgi:cytochrome c2
VKIQAKSAAYKDEIILPLCGPIRAYLFISKFSGMNQKTTFALAIIASCTFFAALTSCGDDSAKKEETTTEQKTTDQPASGGSEVHGPEVKEGDVKLENPLNAQWVGSGKSTYELKCQSCHKLTDERLVGPGWKDVTKRRSPAWIMNMITNVDMMLASDAEAQKLLEQCLVRMPNQNISQDEARQILEFMRSNDGEK